MSGVAAAIGCVASAMNTVCKDASREGWHLRLTWDDPPQTLRAPRFVQTRTSPEK